MLSNDPAPDLVDRSPLGDRLFVALRGSVPLSGDPHNARGSTPGLGIIEVTEGGRTGWLAAVVPLTNPLQQPNQAPDAHGLRVRLTRRWGQPFARPRPAGKSVIVLPYQPFADASRHERRSCPDCQSSPPSTVFTVPNEKVGTQITQTI